MQYLQGSFILSLSYYRNCLFRALADQIDGDHNRHMQFRRSTVQFMRQNIADFEPFHDGETTFDRYCKNSLCNILLLFFVMYGFNIASLVVLILYMIMKLCNIMFEF